jgi:hypothetical protein
VAPTGAGASARATFFSQTDGRSILRKASCYSTTQFVCIQAPVSLNDVVQNVSNSPSRYKVSLYEETAYLPAST